jgi:hypothetical protein
MVENQQNVVRERGFGVGLAAFVAKLDFRDPSLALDHGPHLTADQPLVGSIHEEGDHAEQGDW